jgi:hypothetical protein
MVEPSLSLTKPPRGPVLFYMEKELEDEEEKFQIFQASRHETCVKSRPMAYN